MQSIRSLFDARRVAGLVVLSTLAPAALANFPVVYDQGFPYFNGWGLARKSVNGSEVFANGFNGFGGFGTWDTSSMDGNLSGSGNTGGGIGGPPPALTYTSGSFSSNFAESSILTISGGVNSIYSLPGFIGPGESSSASGGGEFNFSFTVTDTIIAQWSGNLATLKRNGVALALGGAAVWNLEPGLYRVEGSYAGYKNNVGGAFGEGGDSGAGFTLTIGIPAPSSVALLGLAGLGAIRRRR